MYMTLLWTTFVVHLIVTIAFKRTHILDTASFFCLLFCFNFVAELSESHGSRSPAYWAYASIGFAVYALLSFIGRTRAFRSEISASYKSVSPAEVVIAVVLLVLAVGVCSTSKTAVGFLFVPALFFVPATILYALCKRSKAD